MKNKDKGRLPPFVPLLKDTLECPAWKAASFGARWLYVALKSHYNAQFHNNGRIYLSCRKAAEIIGADKGSVAVWFCELQFYGFIAMVSRGHLGINGKGQAPRWRLTEVAYMKDPPTRDFMRWDGVLFQNEKFRIPYGKSVQGVRKIRTVVYGKSVHSMEQVYGKSVQRKGSKCTENPYKSSLPLGGVGGALTEEEVTNLSLPPKARGAKP